MQVALSAMPFEARPLLVEGLCDTKPKLGILQHTGYILLRNCLVVYLSSRPLFSSSVRSICVFKPAGRCCREGSKPKVRKRTASSTGVWTA